MTVKIRKSGDQSGKVEMQMAPMIDIVFQLLIFFILTLKIVEPEGDFNINMPIGAPSQAVSNDIQLPDIKVRLKATDEGQLEALELGRRNLGNDPARCFDLLNREILNIIGSPGNPLTKDIEVEIDADYNLNYEYVIHAVSACSGRLQTSAEGKPTIVRYVEKIKFAPPRRPAGAGA
jgi:biopolymer transport protein ExbD